MARNRRTAKDAGTRHAQSIAAYLAGTAIVAALLARDTHTHRHDRED